MSRVLVVGINYAPESIGIGKYTSELCEWMVAQGHDVRVVTAPPYYPAWRISPEHRSVLMRRERRNGVDVLRCPIWVPKQPRGLTRMVHLASFAISSMVAMLMSAFWRPRLVINVAPALASAPCALMYARLTGAKAWLHIQDFELDAAMDMGIVAAGRFRRFAFSAERWLLRRFDRVSTISKRMIDRLAEKEVSPSRQVLFPNWADISGIRPLSAPSSYRTELGIPVDAIVALYSGNMGLKQGLELLAEAARRLRDESSLYFVFGGEGPGRAALETACANLPNVRFVALQPADRLCEWLGLADIHLLPQRADIADLVMPSKLTGMLASGRPVLATALPDTGVARTLAESGVAVEPGNPDAFVAALQNIIADPAGRRAMGCAARVQAEETLSAHSILTRFARDAAELLGIPDPADGIDPNYRKRQHNP